MKDNNQTCLIISVGSSGVFTYLMLFEARSFLKYFLCEVALKKDLKDQAKDRLKTGEGNYYYSCTGLNSGHAA